CTSDLDGQVHTSPWFRANMTNPSTALSKKPSSSSITSLKKIFGDFPPNSNVTGIIFSDAYCIINLPVVVSPVNAILEILLLDANGFPASTPKPFTTFNTPAGNKSPMISSNIKMEAGVCSAGFNTIQFPAANAGAIFHVAIKIGKFQGIICPTTPNGS